MKNYTKPMIQSHAISLFEVVNAESSVPDKCPRNNKFVNGSCYHAHHSQCEFLQDDGTCKVLKRNL